MQQLLDKICFLTIFYEDGVSFIKLKFQENSVQQLRLLAVARNRTYFKNNFFYVHIMFTILSQLYIFFLQFLP